MTLVINAGRTRIRMKILVILHLPGDKILQIEIPNIPPYKHKVINVARAYKLINNLIK